MTRGVCIQGRRGSGSGGRGLHPGGGRSTSRGIYLQGVGQTAPTRTWESGQYASYWNVFLLLPAMKLGQGNIFRSVCQGFCPQGGGYTPLPSAVHAWRYGQQVGSTHPTGMHTCYFMNTEPRLVTISASLRT